MSAAGDVDPAPTVRVAVDMLGGDHAPDAVIDGVLNVARERPDIQVVLVGPPQMAADLLDQRSAAAAFDVVAASEVVGMTEDPARAVRAKRDATVRVAARLVRERRADATVSVGSTGAAMAAALFTLGRLAGVTRPALAVEVPATRGPVILLDVGANVDCSPDLLAQFALTGAAFAKVRLALTAPRVGLLSIGSEPGKGDALRKEAFASLSRLPIAFVGNVESEAVALGGVADVVVTDGFAGNVLLKGIEAALALARAAVTGALPDVPGASGALDALAAQGRSGGAILLGVDGVAIVGHGASGPREVAACVTLAADAARERLVERVAEAMGDLIGIRRGDAGPQATRGVPG